MLQEDDNIPLRILLLLMDEIFDLKHRWEMLHNPSRHIVVEPELCCKRYVCCNCLCPGICG